jgi:hypothetical protein
MVPLTTPLLNIVLAVEARMILADLVVLLVTLIFIGVPIILACLWNRHFQKHHPEKRPFRWGYYFSIQSFIGGIGLGVGLESGIIPAIICSVIYGVLAWFFAQRQHWAWITLTILSFNPVAWIINFIYLRKRWNEQRAITPAI